MKFFPLPLAGAWLVEPEPVEDERGSYARSWCREEFSRHGLNPNLEQCGVSWNRGRGTLRGMHYQAMPHEEAKLVRCTRGALYDVIVDLRAGSPTWRRWYGVELAAGRLTMLYVPEGFAHGFLTLADDTEVAYQISTAYRPELQRGFRWDDPTVAIVWPQAPAIISARDRGLPLLAP